MLQLAEDKLNRKPFLDNLFSLFENFGNQGNRGFTMIINGKYGSGKSTLLNFIQERNQKNKQFEIVAYNAWENNFFDNPIIPILYEISKLEKTSSKIKDGAKNILKNIPQIILGSLANAHSIDLTSLITNENIFEDYDKYKDAINKFRNILIEYCKNKKVLFLIDELDRCLPEYQIKVLEALYHLFEIPNLIVIIALDRDQLECAIESKFGNTQNTLGYLSKFINYQISLPNDDNNSFIKSLINFECIGSETELVKITISQMLEVMNFSIRDCQMILNEVNLICKEKNQLGEICPVYYWYPLLVTFIVITKYKDDKVYKKWFYKEKAANYDTTKIQFNECTYNQFLKDIENSDLNLIIEYLLQPSYNHIMNQIFLLNLINSFSPINMIDANELANYLNLDQDDIRHASRNGFSYPNSINLIIRKIKILKI